MKVIMEGHLYGLESMEGTMSDQTIQFIEKAQIDGKFERLSDGTTNEEVLAMLINRLQFLQAKAACRENAIVITKLEESLMWLNKRTEDRKARGVEGTANK